MENLISKAKGYNELIQSQVWIQHLKKLDFITDHNFLTGQDLERYFKSIFLNHLIFKSNCFNVEENHNKPLTLELSPDYVIKRIQPIDNQTFKIEILDKSNRCTDM